MVAILCGPFFRSEALVTELAEETGTVDASTATAIDLPAAGIEDLVLIWLARGVDGGAILPLISSNILAVSSITRSGSTVTVTVADTSGLTVAENVVIRGATPTDYNGTWPIATIPNGTTFTFTIGGTPTTPATGTIKYSREADCFETLASVVTSGRPRVMLAGRFNPGASVTIDNSQGAAKLGYIARSYSGVHPDIYSDIDDDEGNGDPNPPEVSPADDKTLCLAFGCSRVGTAANDYNTPPSGYTNFTNLDVGEATSDTNAILLLSEKFLAAAGAENPGIYGSLNLIGWSAITIALKPNL